MAATLKQLGLEKIHAAKKCMQRVIANTPLQKNNYLSEMYHANIFIKREDLQVVRSFKIRGAYNKIKSQEAVARKKSVVCASAGNHAQGVAYSCAILNIHGTIFMPLTTPKQKVEQVKWFGKDWVEVKLTGDTFDDCCKEAILYCTNKKSIFIHPFDDEAVIQGQGTLALELLEQCESQIDYMFIPIGDRKSVV